MALKKKLYCFLVILDEFDIQMKQCRQWGWSKKVLDGVSAMQEASKEMAELLAGVEEVEGKKHVLAEAPLVAMHNASFCHVDQHVLTLSIDSQGNGCQSKEFREN